MAKTNSLLDVQNLTKSFGASLLFEDISFSIIEGHKVGLIARNGIGKSTLLSIIAGGEGYDDGTIVFRRDITVGYLPQSPSFDPEMSVIDACFNHNHEEDKLLYAKQILTKLKIVDLNQRMGELSGGFKKRVALANVLITNPDLLILDEPTNHLDLEMIEWLEEYLMHGNKTLLMVTHDRFFLDRVCDEILELSDRTIYSYKGNYSYYLEKSQERAEQRKAVVQRANNLYRKELEWMKRMPQARGHKARYREEAFYELESIAKQRIQERQVKLLKNSGVYIGNKIFECQYISKAWSPEKVILKDFYYNFSRFEKLGIVGNNGSGKSTFIKMLMGLEKADTGHIVVGNTVKFGYFSQEGLRFNNDQRVIDVVRDIAEYVDFCGQRLSVSQFLQHFMFTPEQQHNYVYKLSGGERQKLYLCTVLMGNPNFLVLDEPTNDLDIMTLQVLEEYLADFAGCLIVVSHDRYFMDKIVDHILVFKGNGEVKDFPGNYTQYREYQSLQPSASQAKEDKKTEKRKSVSKRKMTFGEKREFEQLDREIADLEAEQSLLETELCNGTLSVEELTAKGKRLSDIKEILDEKSMRWLELSEIGG